MATPPEDVSDDLQLAIDELESAVTDIESRLETVSAERDEAKARQVELEIANEGLRRELGLARDHQSASAEILNAIANTHGDAGHALQRIAETTRHFFKAASVTIRIAEGDEWVQTVRVGSGSHLTGSQPTSNLATRGANLPATVYQENRQIHIPDLENVDASMANWPATAARAAGIRTICGSPLRRGGKAIGALIVYRDQPAAFSEDELALHQSFADQAVIALENARLFNESRERLERQTATAEILKVIASSPSDVQPVFEAIAANANRLIGGHSAIVTRIVDGMLHLAAHTAGSEDGSQTLQKYFPVALSSSAIHAIAARTGELVIKSDIEAEPDVPESVKEVARARGYRSIIVLPMLREGISIGAIGVTRREAGPFTAGQVELLRTFADQAVIAIENTRLFNETREALARQTATSNILRVISQSPTDVQPVFDAIVLTAVRLIGCDLGFVLRSDNSTYSPAAGATAEGPMADLGPANLPIDPAANFPSRAIVERKPLHLPDWSRIELPEHERNIRDMFGINSALYLPLLRGGDCIGLLGLAGKRSHVFSESDIALAESFRDQALIALENTRLFNETKEALERQTATADILRVIAGSPSDVQPVFEAIAERSKQLVDALSTTVFRLQDGLMYLKAFTATSAEADATLQAMFPAPLSGFSWSEAIERGEIYRVVDTELEIEDLRELARLRGFRSMLFVPLLRDQKPIGVIAVTRVEPGPFVEHHVQLLQTFADQAVIAIENARLFEEVQQRTADLSESLQQQTAVGDVLKTISRSTFDLQPVLDTLVHTAARLCDTEMAFIMRREGEVYRAGAAVGYSEEYIEFLKSHPLTVDRGTITGRAVLERRTIQILDTATDPEYTLRESTSLAGQHTALCVPLLRENEPIGTIVLARRRIEPFTQKQIDLVTTFADQAVIAIENVRLFDEIRQRTDDLTESLEQQTATSDVLSVISSSAGDLDPVFDAMLGNAMQLCKADFGVLNTFDGERFHTAASHGLPPAYDDYRRSQPLQYGAGTAPARLLSGEAYVEIHDLLDSDAYRTGELNRRALVDVGGARSLLAVPLLKDERVVGNVMIFRQEKQRFSEKQIALLQQFAAQAVIAIENTRLLRELRARTDDLTESLQQQTATAEVLKVISRSAFDLHAVLNTLIESGAKLCEAPHGVIWLRRDEQLHLAAHVGYSQDWVWTARNNPITPDAESQTVSGRVAATGEYILLEDVLADPRFSSNDLHRIGQYRSVLMVPLIRDGKVEGTIGFTRLTRGPFTQRQIELVQTFADQAVIAIENVRLFDEVQARTRELAASLDDLRTAQDRLVQTEKLASLGQLTAGIAHEIKNPLNFVNNFAALSAELTDELKEVLAPVPFDHAIREEVGELTGLLKDNLEKVVQHGKRADSIVKNMLLHSREGSGDHRPADINALLDESLNLAYHGARAEKPAFNVTLQRDFDPAAGTIEVFPQEITRVFLNLISNGFYAVTRRKADLGETGFDPLLSASTRNLGDTVEIRVRDNGTGIPPEVKDKMFNPFFTTKPAGEGTGLGLSMSHDIIVKQHGGSIDVETEPGKFTEFRIVLPRKGITRDRQT